MDNNAFRALINERQLTSQKSTKEIAREAVENEFRRKKQSRSGGGGYDSDSDDNTNNDEELTKRRRRQVDRTEETNEPEWKRRRRTEKAAAGTTAGGYRDRAKERREGRNLDYDNVTSTAILHNEEDKKRQAELSKFLGGDEEHTHLVRGLDMALAQKVRREEMLLARGGREEQDLDQLLEDAIDAQQKTTSKTSSIDRIQPKCDLGKSVLKYLQQRQHYDNDSNSITRQQQSIQRNQTKQNSIQRSHYTFSLYSNVQKRHAAWDVPQLKMIGATSSSFERGGMTPLDYQLIATIKKKLDGTIANSNLNKRNKDAEIIGKSGNGKEQSLKRGGEEEITPKDDNAINEKTATASTLAKKDASDDDSDDDIFADVGTYIPPTAAVTANVVVAAADPQTRNDPVATTSTPSVPKKQTSIFENLIADQNNNKVSKPEIRQPIQHPQLQQTQLNIPNKNVIDRDVFGGSRKRDEQEPPVVRRRGPQTVAMEGVSMTNYHGGYGEEMDTDFLNEEEDEYRKLKRRVDEGEKGGDDDIDAGVDEED